MKALIIIMTLITSTSAFALSEKAKQARELLYDKMKNKRASIHGYYEISELMNEVEDEINAYIEEKEYNRIIQSAHLYFNVLQQSIFKKQGLLNIKKLKLTKPITIGAYSEFQTLFGFEITVGEKAFCNIENYISRKKEDIPAGTTYEVSEVSVYSYYGTEERQEGFTLRFKDSKDIHTLYCLKSTPAPGSGIGIEIPQFTGTVDNGDINKLLIENFKIIKK